MSIEGCSKHGGMFKSLNKWSAMSLIANMPFLTKFRIAINAISYNQKFIGYYLLINDMLGIFQPDEVPKKKKKIT